MLSSGYPIDFYNLKIVVAISRDNKPTYSFGKKFVDITPTPVYIKTFDDVDRWYDDSMLYYCEQYKFALYCATALCGVSKDQLTRGLPLTNALMNFHVMYQIKKILAQLEARKPNDQDFDRYNNPYNKTEYKKLLNEFGVRRQDIPEIDQPAGGLGFMRVSFGPSSKTMSLNYDLHRTVPNYPSTGLSNNYMNVQKKGGDWGNYYHFGGSGGYPIDSISQDKFNYNRVVPDHSKLFTNAGLVRLNDSIRAYVYCLLGGQVQARQAGSSLESQQEFLVLVNDLIAKKQSLEESIKNFEDALSKTRGKINYVVAKGLYMLPADMNLNKLGQSVAGFNDELQIAQSFDTVGIRPKPSPIKPIAKPPPIKPVAKPPPIKPVAKLPNIKPSPIKTVAKLPTTKPVAKQPSIKPDQEPITENVLRRSERDIHEGIKTAITVGISGIGIVYYMLT